MLEDRQDWLGKLAEAIADGCVLDWDAIESSAQNDVERESIRRLRAIAAIGLAHSELTLSESLSESLSVRTMLRGVEHKSTPATWGSLRILERVGRGRFGDVYRAWDPNLDREVALKLHRHRDSPSSSADREVIEEGRLMARVRHPNVVTVYGAQRIDGRIGLWMEFVEGQTLEAELKERGPFSADEVARIGVELCRALSAVHEAGLVHRDVKAQNVLRNRNGRVLLGDFGTGRDVQERETPGNLAGTPAYLAPEIFCGSAATAQTDVYSLGVLLFHLTTGGFPIRGRSLAQIREAHNAGDRVGIESLRSGFSAPLTRIIERAIAPVSANRFESAADMESALTLSLSGKSSGWSRKTAMSAVLAVVLVALTISWFRGKQAGAAASGGQVDSTAAAVVDRLTPDPVIAQVQSSMTAQPKPESPVSKPAISPLSVSTPATPNQAPPVGSSTPPPRPPGRIASIGRRFFAFIQSGEVMTHEGETATPRRITGQDSGDTSGLVDSVRFTFDGLAVIYIRLVPRPGSDETIPEIRSIPTIGGRSRLIWRSDDSRYLHFFQWPGCDQILVARRAPHEDGEFLVISAATGTVLGRQRAPLGINQYGAQLSFDGRYVIYEQPDTSGQRDLHLWAVSSGAVTPLVVGPDDEFRPILVRTGGTNSRLGVTFQRDRSGQIAQFLQWVIDGKPLGEPQAMLPPTAVQPDGPPISTDSTTPPSQAGLRATQMNMAAAGCAHQAIDY